MTKNITTPTGATEFQVRIYPDEGVGLLTTRNNENYLILDSLEFWYDLIQNEYPKKKKCSCKNEWFHVQFKYIPRPGTDDFREVKIIGTGTACKNISRPASIDIDYSPTNHLADAPITFCERPNIKYKYTQLTSYWSGDNLKKFLEFIFTDMKLNVYCWFWQHPENTRKFEKVSLAKPIQIITVNHWYLNFYFTANELDTARYADLTSEDGVYIKEDIWRKEEIIELSSPFVMVGYGLLYLLTYCNEYLDKGKVVSKPEDFEQITNRIKSWLKDNFVTMRGKNCFDGKEAYEKFAARRALR